MTNIITPFDEAFEKREMFSGIEPGMPESDFDSLVSNSVSKHISSPSYALAFRDEAFVMSDAARGIRIQMEMDKPEWIMKQHGIRSTVIVFGSARFVSRKRAERLLEEAQTNLAKYPKDEEYKNAVSKAELLVKTSAYYELARQFAYIVSKDTMNQTPQPTTGPYDYVICTGGGPGIMEAANRGAHEAGAQSIGLNIKLPYEQTPNPYTSPHLCFQFHYFNVRKLHFMLRAKALAACPGGFGTFDELFEALTLRQTERMQRIPIVLLGSEFWQSCVNFDYLVASGVITRDDLSLFHITDDPQEAWDVVKSFYREAG
ncbi:hypothetical protein FACS1894170_10780 [Planctomycetales bacterium]|nr:hypothetical protein FACS1894170_10780 [Planctomycetales bacterium]